MQFNIRRSQPADAADVARMMGDEAVYANLMQVPYPSESRWRQTLEGNETLGNIDTVLVAESGGKVVASAGLHGPGRAVRRRHVMGLGISVSREAQGQGVGRALMAALTDYADNWGHVLRIELNVYADNERAIQLYKRFGFVQEGVHRAYALRGGELVDSLSMARLHPNPPRLPGR